MSHKQNYLIELNVDDQTRERLGEAMESFVYPWRVNDFEDFVRRAREVSAATLPLDVRKAIMAMRTARHPAGAMIIRNLPVDPSLPATPRDGKRSLEKLTSVSEALIVGISAIFGEPYGYHVEKGTLVHDVAPVREAASELTNRGAGELGMHTELAAFTHSPRWLSLLGLRADHDRVAATPVADIRLALPLLSSGARAALRGLEYRTRMPFIFDPMFEEAERYTGAHAVVAGPGDSPSVRGALYGDLTRPLSTAAALALDELKDAMALVARPVLLEPGVMLILSNRIVMHGRSPYTPRFDGTDRWFQRVHVADSLWELRHWQNANVRVLDR